MQAAFVGVYIRSTNPLIFCLTNISAMVRSSQLGIQSESSDRNIRMCATLFGKRPVYNYYIIILFANLFIFIKGDEVKGAPL